MKPKTLLILRINLLIATAVSLFFVPWSLVFAWLAPLPDSVQEQLKDAVANELDGIIVYVDRAGSLPVLYASGWHDRGAQIPAKPQALFKIASIRKLYVAAALSKMASAQMLSLDESLADYFPELKSRIENADDITLRLMAKHRSGIPNLTDHPDFPWDDPPKSSPEQLEYALDLPADFAPNEDYAYSNTNYLLLTEVMNKVLGFNHFQYIQTEILDPLNLKNTFISLHAVESSKVMSGYHVGYEPDIKNNHFGAMIATAEDVGIFLRALNDGSLLNSSEQATYSSIYEFEHTGLVPGYSSFASYHKDIDTVVIQFVNTSGGVSWNMAEIVHNRIEDIVRRSAD